MPGLITHLIAGAALYLLGRYSFISLVDRTQLKSLIDEIALGQTGIIDEATALKAGRVHGLQLIIEGTIDGDRVTARAIHTETLKVIATASANGRNEIERLGKKLAAGIETFIARENLKRLRNDSPGINLEFWLETKGSAGAKISARDRGPLKIGKSVSFHFRSNRDGYLTIVDIQPNGDVVLLYPNDFSKTNEVKAGIEYSIPSKNDEFEITVTEPAGQDTIVAYFTLRKVDWLDKNRLSGDGFRSVNEGEKIGMSRGFNVAATKLKSDEWESTVLLVDVEK